MYLRQWRLPAAVAELIRAFSMEALGDCHRVESHLVTRIYNESPVLVLSTVFMPLDKPLLRMYS